MRAPGLEVCRQRPGQGLWVIAGGWAALVVSSVAGGVAVRDMIILVVLAGFPW